MCLPGHQGSCPGESLPKGWAREGRLSKDSSGRLARLFGLRLYARHRLLPLKDRGMARRPSGLKANRGSKAQAMLRANGAPKIRTALRASGGSRAQAMPKANGAYKAQAPPRANGMPKIPIEPQNSVGLKVPAVCSGRAFRLLVHPKCSSGVANLLQVQVGSVERQGMAVCPTPRGLHCPPVLKAPAR